MVELEYSTDNPLNREPPLGELVSSYITEKGAYDRNHGPIPHLSASDHIMKVEGEVKHAISFSIPELAALPQHKVLCALQCAGNRRYMMETKFHKPASGINWFDGAVMNCMWEGPRLKDVLSKAGVTIPKEEWDNSHVAFACFSTKCQEDEWYGGSIFLERAMREDADVILAMKMNGETLTPAHGYPIRAVVPGIAGARSVKWLDKITVQRTESENFYQKKDYKVLPPQSDTPEKAQDYWDKVPALQDMPVNSVVAIPAGSTTVQADARGLVSVKGYALPQGEDGPIVKVEVSGDDGNTWVDAELLVVNDDVQGWGLTTKWAWCLWQAAIKIEKGKGRNIVSRATDKGGNVQEASPEWNLRGVCYNGFGEVRDIEVI